jgi:hypothetical protein
VSHSKSPPAGGDSTAKILQQEVTAQATSGTTLRSEISTLWMMNQTAAGIDSVLKHVREQAELYVKQAETMQIKHEVPKNALQDPSPAIQSGEDAKRVPVCRAQRHK